MDTIYFVPLSCLVLLVNLAQGQNNTEDVFYTYYNYGDEKIVNGFEADMRDFYYQVSIRLNGRHFCGGTIISDRFILTAGHCTRAHIDNPKKLSILAGTPNVNSETQGQTISVMRIYQHDNFNATTLDYDMSLLELDKELDFNAFQRPIRVTRNIKFPLDALGVVSGWGYMTEGGQAAQTLQAVRLPLIPPLTCREFYRKALTPRMICAGYLLGEKDACQGDSGGPLVYNREIIGVVSWGKGCARPNKPGVYTNIAELRSFITKWAGIV